MKTNSKRSFLNELHKTNTYIKDPLGKVNPFYCKFSYSSNKSGLVSISPGKDIMRYKLHEGKRKLNCPKAPHNTSKYLIDNFRSENKENFGPKRDRFNEDQCIVAGGTMKNILNFICYEDQSESESLFADAHEMMSMRSTELSTEDTNEGFFNNEL
jgi:hypothetical protein